MIFASVALALLIFLMSGTGGIFSSNITIYAYFENAAGIRVGGPVKLEGVEIGNVTALKNSITVLPSTFSVTFGAALWKDIEVKLGERKVLNPGVVSVPGADIRGYPIKDEAGTVVASVSATQSSAPLPPGKYTLEIGAQKVPIELAAGQKLEIKLN